MRLLKEPGHHFCRRLAGVTALLAGLLFGGCRSFEHDWQAAAVATGDITGRWLGTWQNTNNAHAGPLRAVVTAGDGAGRYRARFHARWGRFAGSFRSTLAGTNTPAGFAFTGRERVLGVRIDTAGLISGTNFHATYDSAFDRGTFTLERPPTAPPP
jgi:hypothetical protein